MDIFKSIINPDVNKLKRFIITNAARELSALSEPCYYPKTKRFYFELLDILKVKDRDVKDLVKRTYQGTKAASWNLWKHPATNLLVFLMHYFLDTNDRVSYSATMVYYIIIQFSRLMNKQIKYCDPDAFRYTLDTLTKTHLFFREKSIPNSLYYLSTQMQNKFTDGLLRWNIDDIIAFIGESRHRISQSVKSFAESYYKNKKSGIAIRTQGNEPEGETDNYQYQVLQRGQKIVDDVAKKITMYKTIDAKSFDTAREITKIKTSMATTIAQGITNSKYFNNIKIALQLFIKEVTSASMLCGNEYVPLIKKLMSVKRTIAQLYFKAQINILLLDVLKDMDFLKEYEKYTLQTQFIISSFLAFYITSILRNSVCNT